MAGIVQQVVRHSHMLREIVKTLQQHGQVAPANRFHSPIVIGERHIAGSTTMTQMRCHGYAISGLGNFLFYSRVSFFVPGRHGCCLGVACKGTLGGKMRPFPRPRRCI